MAPNTPAVVAHPGQANTFDGQAYDAVVTVRSVVDSLVKQEAQFPSYKSQIEQARVSFNSLEALYLSYHNTAILTPNSPDLLQIQLQLSSGLATIATQLTTLQTAFGKTPTPVTIPQAGATK
jgi:hypothetical protein